MATKNNIRSIRFSDELAELIEQQEGKNFQQKFENLVRWCVQELPDREARIKVLDKEILKKQHMMAEASSRYARMINQLSTLESKLYALDFAIGRALDEWPNYET